MENKSEFEMENKSEFEESVSEMDKDVVEIGAIFHWGIYSVPGFDDIKSLRRRRNKNGSEWYKKRLLENSTYRPISGYVETQNHHNDNYEGKLYDDFAVTFNENVKNFDINDWFDSIENESLSYVILTAKHHDGFCLWDTNTTSLKSERDFVEEFVQCARKRNLKVGIYYSWYEFGKSVTKEFFQSTIFPQIIELEIYEPDYWWFDGDWCLKTKYSKRNVLRLINKLKESAEVNSRIGEDCEHLGSASFKVYGDRTIPSYIPSYNWEYIFTIGHSWGYNREQMVSDYKTGEDILKLYKKVKSKKGRFLINFGPTGEGLLDMNELNSYNNFMGMIN
jgi:alpha-L-fucosidase